MAHVTLRQAGEHAQRILQAVREGARAAPEKPQASPVASSWERCLHEHRLHPDRPRRPAVVDAAELRRRQACLADLMACARQEMAVLYEQLADADCAVVLTDTDGVILHMVSAPAFAADVDALGFHMGAVWSEAEAGTNGMGTCLAAASPVAVRREDHFFTQLTSLSCSAVPVLDPQGRMAAVLDVTSRSSLPQQHSLVLLGMTAQTIENRLLERSHPGAHLLHFHSRPEFVYTLHEGKLALDDAGTVLAGNRSALFQLGLASMEALRGRTLDALFRTGLAELAGRCERSALHPVVCFAAQGGNRFFVVARRCTGEGTEAAERIGSDRIAAHARALDARATAPSARGRRTPAPSLAPPRDASFGDASLGDASFADTRLAASMERARRALAREIPVLLQGETGSGKEVFARALHAASPHAGGRFVAINCASLPESLIEAELFGYRAGAFTGALRSGRRGKIAEADGGTLFLDEIGDMPLSLQARLLRVLDERQVTPLGAEESLAVAFQLLSASHRDLGRAVAEGRFREDLYYRLCGFTVALPPLRERSDRAALIAALLRHEAARSGQGEPALTPAAEELLRSYAWPGNLRQLRHVLHTALALVDDGEPIDLAQLPSLVSEGSLASATPAGSSAAIAGSAERAIGPAPVPSEGEDGPPVEPADDRAAPGPVASADNALRALPPMNPIQRKEREVLLQLLERHRWNVSNVAEALDVSRNTLYRKLHRLHIALSHPPAERRRCARADERGSEP